MSKKYDDYLTRHINSVKKCYELLTGEELESHDKSKYSAEEYSAYDNFFYSDKTEDVKRDFRHAWNHHQKCNPHHWQYWVLINDNEGIVCLDIPGRYINEMVADWGAFSLIKKSPNEIIDWYNNNRGNIMLSDPTRTIVERKVHEMAELLEKHLRG